MACSEARLAANRANALKSTGPKTEEGKDASRRNALKHGLTGAGIVVPGEDAAEVAREAAALLIELAPDGLPTARLLAERVATLAVRLRRSARHESAATAERAHLAADDFDETRSAEAARLFEAIDEGTNRDELLAMPEGVDLLDATLADLRAVAAGDPAGWSGADSARLTRCLASDPGEVGPIVERIDAERARLESLRAGLDHEAVARARAAAVHLVLVDADPETLLARKYEAATERSLFRALREVREIRKLTPANPHVLPPPSIPSPADLAPPAEPAPVPAVGSSFPVPQAASAMNPASARTDAGPAPRGRSRFEDRRQRPRLGR